MPHLSWLDAEQRPFFPSTAQALAQPNGLLAAGGALTPDWLLCAYQAGIFPWFNEGEPILWWSPSPRMILPTSRVHISRSLRKWYRRNSLQVTLNQQFEQVISHCQQPRQKQQGTWISEDMAIAYITLHRLGWAHSIEVWQQDQLVGGLYGIGISPVFYGESMFSRQPNASKLAFVALDCWAQQRSLTMIDCQVYNEHLASLGAVEIDRDSFERALPLALKPVETIPETQLNQLLMNRLGTSTASKQV